ncbi:MAG: lysozyme inhibitor LprI family protein [Cyanobacteria bacterium P01_A01_bin.105]
MALTAMAVACRTSSPTAIPQTTDPASAPSTTTEPSRTDAKSPSTNPPSTNPPSTNPSPSDAVEVPVGTPAQPTDGANPVAAEKQDCGQLATQLDINACAHANYTVSDRLLNQVYQTLRSGLSAENKTQLTTAEQAWINFRDAQCEFERSRFEGGSIAPLILSSCLEQITDLRIDELRAQSGATQTYETADARLNQVYQELEGLMDDSVWPSFQAVQIDWLAYRDANCAYEDDATLFTEEQCLARMTVLRTAQLGQQLERWSL